MKNKFFYHLVLLIIFLINFFGCAQDQEFIKENFIKKEYKIPMRDRAKLFTAVYSPVDTTLNYPILLLRTPYSISPYGEDKYSKFIAPSEEILKDGYIFVWQDVRGKFMSEGEYVNMRPYIPEKVNKNQVDESSDTYDTIDWLVKNIPHNNGKVGLWGISYPGFYAAMGLIDAHPALKAVSPQAPIADWFIGDDMHHNGAFTVLLAFNFFKVFGIERSGLTTTWAKPVEYPSPDAYTFFMSLGPLKNVNEKYFNGKIKFWNETMQHGTYDEFWQSRSNLKHFQNVTPAVLTVGGWYDAEDLYGSLNIYKSIEDNNENTFNVLVMGPWKHGGWARTKGDSLGDFSFGSRTSDFYNHNILFQFFNHFLKGNDTLNLPEAYIFDTGLNEWKKYNRWSPDKISQVKYYFYPNNKLSPVKPTDKNSKLFDEFISDPDHPIPYTAKIIDSKGFYNRNFMIEDQRFASFRPDVLVYQTEPLKENITVAGPITANLFVSTTGTDADWVVKLIDVYPDDSKNPVPNPNEVEMGGYQRLVRAEIMRGKFRNSYENPEPFVPGKITNVKINLNDVDHTFLTGHRIMVQIQSSWFPLFDRNPQTYTDIYKASEENFMKATHKVYFSEGYPSNLVLPVFKKSLE